MTLQTFSSLDDIEALAHFAHRNQRDQAGHPYIKHPKRVLAAVQADGAPPYVQMAAILHDVTEDTAFTCAMLIELGVPAAAVNIVMLLDRDYSELVHWKIWKQRDAYHAAGNLVVTDFSQAGGVMERERKKDRDEFYYEQIRNNPGALQVKLADIGDNLQPWRLVYLPQEKQARLRKKYATALHHLTGSPLPDA